MVTWMVWVIITMALVIVRSNSIWSSKRSFFRVKLLVSRKCRHRSIEMKLLRIIHQFEEKDLQSKSKQTHPTLPLTENISGKKINMKVALFLPTNKTAVNQQKNGGQKVKKATFSRPWWSNFIATSHEFFIPKWAGLVRGKSPASSRVI